MICNVIACYSYQLSTNEKDVFWVLVSFVDLLVLIPKTHILIGHGAQYTLLIRGNVCKWNCVVDAVLNSCRQTGDVVF